MRWCAGSPCTATASEWLRNNACRSRRIPGQRAAVSGFVCYLCEKHRADIALPKVNSGKALLNRRKKLEAEMLALMQEGGEGERFRQWRL